MSLFEKTQHTIKNTVFFANMGKDDLDDDKLILFSNLEELLISPLDFTWLPTSATQDDPFYIKQINPKSLIEQRIKITRCIMANIDNIIPHTQFIYEAHDFNAVAKNALCYAFRQYLMERYFSLGSSWQNIVKLYYKGHWPIGLSQDKLVVI